MLRLACLLCCLMLTACASAQQLAANDDATCQSFGAPPGTQAYFDCRMNLDQRRANHRRDVANTLAQGLQDVGHQMSQRGQNTSSGTSCVSRRNGDVVYTDCD